MLLLPVERERYLKHGRRAEEGGGRGVGGGVGDGVAVGVAHGIRRAFSVERCESCVISGSGAVVV